VGTTANDRGAFELQSLPADTPPIAEANGPYTVEQCQPLTLSAAGSIAPVGTITAYDWELDNDSLFDDATGETPVLLSSEVAALGLALGMPHAIALRVTSDNGVTDLDFSTLTISADATDPSITCPGDQMIAGDASGNASMPDFTGLAAAMDACGIAFVTQSPIAGMVVSGGPFPVTLTATDNNSRTAQCVFMATVTTRAPFVVTTVNDTSDANAGNGICDDGTGECSLRAAIEESNALAGDDAITFASPLFDTAQTIALGGTELVIDSNINIQGPGADLLTIDADSGGVIDRRVFQVTGNSTGAGSILSGMTMTGGFDGGSGGGVLSAGALTITNSTISGNSSNFGGGLLSGGGPLTITNSTISGNSASATGGGIYNSADTLTITNSTIFGNSASGSGGGLLNQGTILITITNSTISGNSDSFGGGGIYNAGIAINLNNTIVANNTAPADPDVFGNFASGGFNLIGNTSGGSGFGGSDILNPAGGAGLDPAGLQDNGGPTPTIALLSTSPALNAGSTALTTDQRGEPRPGGLGDNGNDDIGAFEGSIIVNSAPTISDLGDQTILRDGMVGPIAFTVGDAEDMPGNLTLSISGLPSGVTHSFGGSDANRTLMLTADCSATLDAATVTVTVMDSGSLTAVDSFTLTVNNETTAPTIACPANVMVNADAGECFATGVNLGTPTTGDNCGVAMVSNNAPASFPVGMTTVTWTVMDANGNMAMCATQTVTVVDNQNPTIACPANVMVNADAGQCFATGVSLGTPTTGDNCGVAMVSNNAPASFPVGMTAVTWTVMDANGNMAMCATQTVTVIDNQPPTANCPTNITVPSDNPGGGANVTFTLPAPSDNCAGSMAMASPSSGSFFPVGTTPVSVSAMDAAGNMSAAPCSFTVTVLPFGSDPCAIPPAALDLAGFAANKLSATFGDGPTAPGIVPSPNNSSDFPSAMASMPGGPGAVVLAAASRKEQVVWLFELDTATGFIMDQTRFGSGTTPALHGGFPSASLTAGDNFGSALAWLGDYGTNGTVELAVGVPGEDGGTANSNRGGYWVVSVNLANAFDGNPATLPATSATLVSPDAIDAASADSILANVGLSSALSALDTNADGLADWLAAGAPNRVNASGHQAGGLWLLDLSATGTTAAAYRFLAPDETLASVAYAAIQSRHGDALAWLGDADANPATFEIAAGSPHHRGALGGLNQSGIFHVQSFDLTGASPVLMSSFPVGGSTGLGGFPAGQLGQADFFGQSLALLGDIDADGYLELAVGAPGDDDGGSNQGAVWVLTLDLCSAPNISIEQGKVTELAPNDLTGFGTTPLDSTDYFGWSLAALPPPTGADAGLAAGALYDDDGGSNRGAVWVLDVSDND
jgi:CSLREA domain-containing protein